MLEPSFLPNHQTLSLSFPLLLTWPWPGQKKRESRRDRGVCVCVCAMRCVGGGACSADPSSFPPSPLPACAPPPPLSSSLPSRSDPVLPSMRRSGTLSAGLAYFTSCRDGSCEDARGSVQVCPFTHFCLHVLRSLTVKISMYIYTYAHAV